MQLTKTLEKQIEEFKAAISGARQELQRAGEILVEMLDANENAMELILEHCPGTSLEGLETLERIGRHKLEPRLLTDTCPAAQLAVARALPMAEQKQLMNETVPVVVEHDGGTKVVHKRMHEIKNRESTRVIGDGKLRTVKEQEQLIMVEKSNRAARALRYQIDGGKVTFHGDCTFTWSELDAICKQIAPKSSDIKDAIVERQIKR